MNYKVVNIRASSSTEPLASVLIIYTGGTIGMVYDTDGSLVPFNFSEISRKIPELANLDLKLTIISLPHLIDSSNVSPKDWEDLTTIIRDNYEMYDGFVILHGTDTMAYSASALSYSLRGIRKAVVFTGAQIPIGEIRSDARENLITALQIASAKQHDASIVKEVCIYFNYTLLRGNRSQKVRSSTFAAFESQNYPALAQIGIFIEYHYSNLLVPADMHFNDSITYDPNVIVLKLSPGIDQRILRIIFRAKNLRGVVLEAYGSGNTPSDPGFLKIIKKAIDAGVIIYNVSQCSGGEVIMGRYETSKKLKELGVISGGDITTEAAVTKLMFLLGTEKNMAKVREKLQIPLNGEMDR